MKPKNWIISQKCTSEQLTAIKNGATWWVEKETEKAYLFVAGTDFGTINMWCPKSQIEEDEIEETMSEEETIKKYKEYDRKIANGLEYNMKLREVLNANGIKTSMNRKIKTATLIENLKNAGIEIPAR